MRSKKDLLVKDAADQAAVGDVLERRYRHIADSGLTQLAPSVETTAAESIGDRSVAGVVGKIVSRESFARELIEPIGTQCGNR